MTLWIFKLSEQAQYADILGRKYVYDNRHSVKVAAGDQFLYLDKRLNGYGFTGHGVVARVLSEEYRATERDQSRIHTIFAAELEDFIEYAHPLDLRSTSVDGKSNRASLGIKDVNKLGWSRSIAQVGPAMYSRIIDLAYRRHCISILPPSAQDYAVSDSWSFVRRRHNLERFRKTVLHRQGYACAICGTTLSEVLDVAHISRYATDVANRANPANGIALCAYCHRAFDRGIFRLQVNGIVSVADESCLDQVAMAHLSNLSAEARQCLIRGVDPELLRQR